MTIPLIIGVTLCGALLITTKVMEKKNKDAKEAGIAKLQHGTRIKTINGMVGTVDELTDHGTIKVDFSPDQSGSIVEITKEAFYKTEE
ncbi:MAG: preprotein translocase subunit YajC [Lachnospiraceae bacterium]|nr:preprotein translocase subunit YajC [Lachnospiraceae bacterium]